MDWMLPDGLGRVWVGRWVVCFGPAHVGDAEQRSRATPAADARPFARDCAQMEQERRPPYQGCWLIKEFRSMTLTKLQILNQGGEEFEGEDTG